MSTITFLLDHRHTVSLVMGTLGVLIAIAAVAWPRRRPMVRIAEGYEFAPDDLIAQFRKAAP